MIAWTLKLSRIFIYLSMAFNSYPLPNAYLLWIWSFISFLYTTEKYLQSTPCPWQVILSFVVESLDHLHFWLLLWITCFYCQTCFIKLLLSSLYLFGLWCALPKFVLCFIELEKAMIPFLCIYIQKSYFLTMHYSWGSYPTLCRTPFFNLVLHLLAFLEHD